MKFIIAKVIFLSFVFMTAACSEKEPKEQQTKEEATQEKNGKKSPQVRFKAVPPRDESTYKNPTF